MAFRKIETAGVFLNFREVGQSVTVKVGHYDPAGGSDFDDNPVPRVVGTAIADSFTFGAKADGYPKRPIGTGEQVTIDGGNASLRKGLLMADAKKGDLMRVTFTGTYQTDKGNEGKAFTVEVDDGTDEEVVAI